MSVVIERCSEYWSRNRLVDVRRPCLTCGINQSFSWFSGIDHRHRVLSVHVGSIGMDTRKEAAGSVACQLNVTLYQSPLTLIYYVSVRVRICANADNLLQS